MKRYIILFSFLFLSVGVHAQSVKFFTYNIRLNIQSDGENAWDFRKSFLVDQLKFYAPDIIGTQEGLPDQISYLDQQLSHYSYVGIGREGKAGGAYCYFFIVKTRFEVLTQETFWLSPTPGKVSRGWGCGPICVSVPMRYFRIKKRKQNSGYSMFI